MCRKGEASITTYLRSCGRHPATQWKCLRSGWEISIGPLAQLRRRGFSQHRCRQSPVDKPSHCFPVSRFVLISVKERFLGSCCCCAVGFQFSCHWLRPSRAERLRELGRARKEQLWRVAGWRSVSRSLSLSTRRGAAEVFLFWNKRTPVQHPGILHGSSCQKLAVRATPSHRGTGAILYQRTDSSGRRDRTGRTPPGQAATAFEPVFFSPKPGTRQNPRFLVCIASDT